MINIALVEEDGAIAEIIKKFISHFAETTNLDYTLDVYTGLDFVSDYNPIFDIVIMNTHLSKLDVIKAVKRLRQLDENFLLFFITNDVRTAIHGYEVGAAGYLLTPLQYTSFLEMMQRGLKNIERNNSPTIILKTQDGFKRIRICDILYIEVMGHFLIYHTLDESIRVRGTLKSLEEKLCAYHFIKCNSCYLVNLHHIKGCSEMNIEMKGISVPISRRRKKEVMEQLLKSPHTLWVH